MTARLRELASAVHLRSGIHLSDAQLGSLTAALKRLGPGATPDRLLDDADPRRRAAALDRLVDGVTVNETFFFRNREELDRIDWPDLLASAHAAGRPRARVWSAACSSGEEAYTLAVLAAEGFGGGPIVPVEVLGTDISPTILTLAREGVYGPRSTRLLSPEQRDRWFAEGPAGLRVGDRLRSLVRFAEHNLSDGASGALGDAPYDLIVCRNVLIYFDPETVARVVAGLRARLAPRGLLLLGTADRLGVLPPVRPARAPRPKPDHQAPRPRPRPIDSVPAGAPTAPAPTGGDPVVSPALLAFDAGVRALGEGEPPRAVELLRRALYLDPGLTVAALQLGRAHEADGDPIAARRAYGLALRQAAAQDPSVRLHDRIGAGDVAAACRARLTALEGA